ncbi:hypothetical protein J5N97_008512 [Dioscorea zingiberensis]|uniref:RING-type domain-containing protein n=1 Tax=Dioscorea zingiberensis TaxID=325984 RepID=A0A9D5CWG5_9LILI|nr:hypothetical protein J5N97_008512 [Dioscorea zingiberensis]
MAIQSSLSTPLGEAACENDAKILNFIEEATTNTDEIQEKILAEILSRNAETEYLQRYKLGGATDRETFKSKVPVVTYEDLLPDIQRIANGDRSPILSAHPISEFLTSSGTSAGERKLMPTIQEEVDRRQLLYSLLMPVMNLYVPELDKGKGLYFLFVKSETKTPGGLVARPVLTSYYNSDQFRKRPFDPYNVYTSPTAAILCPDSFQSMYSQMLCGLLHRLDVNRVGAVFASGLLRAIRFLQLHWQQLSLDIATGNLSPNITNPAIRNAISPILNPDPELSAFIISQCSSGDWAGIIKRIWPNTKYLDVIVTGAMAQYIPTLEFYGGGLPMACTMYASSECYFGINLRPMCHPSDVTYTIMPMMGYFEFLPYQHSSSGDLVDLANLEVGKEYELVITTYSGLCRYRVGDILLVTGYHNAAPEFRFIRRKNVLLSIESDKTDEAELQQAVARASDLIKPFGASVVEYTSQADTKVIPGHYVIYWELLLKSAAEMPSGEVLEKCCLEMEEAMNTVYRQSRVADGSIGPLEIRVVKPGTFEELMDYAISRGASINQYKVPRVNKKCARALIPFLVWFFVALRLWYGNYGNNRLVLGPSSSRIVKTSSVFVKEINVKGKENKGLFLYGFSDRPELGSETNNSTTRYSLFLDSFNHQEFSLWLNKGSKLSMKWNVDVLHGGVTNGDQVLLVLINKGHRQNLKSLKRYEYLESQEINEVKYIVEEDNTYNIAIQNLNPQSIAMDLNVSVSSTMYDTTKATSFCSVTNTTCKLKLDFPRSHYFVLTTPNSEDIHGEEWSSVEITFTVRIVIYFFIFGMIMAVVWIILHQLDECGNAQRERTQEERESEPILATKEILCKYGTSEDPETSLSGSFNDQLYDEKICILCYEESRTCFFTPCGHSISCFSCAQRIMKEENKLCPICRRLIHKLRKLPAVIPGPATKKTKIPITPFPPSPPVAATRIPPARRSTRPERRSPSRSPFVLVAQALVLHGDRTSCEHCVLRNREPPGRGGGWILVAVAVAIDHGDGAHDPVVVGEALDGDREAPRGALPRSMKGGSWRSWR